MRDTEHLAGILDTGEELLCGRGGVYLFDFTPGGQAVVAETTGDLRWLFSEVAQQRYAPTRLGLGGVAERRLQARLAAGAFLWRALVNKLRTGHHVAAAE